MSRRDKTRVKTDLRQRFEATRHTHSDSDNKRLDSFRCWRGQIHQEALVDAGFYYIGEEDAVQCFSCKVEIKNWTKDMDPLVEHVKHAPHCRHLLRLIPLEVLAEMKDQLFGIKKMRVPTDGAIKWPCNKFTGARVDEEVHDVIYIRVPQQFVEQNVQHLNNEESNREAIRSVDMFSEGSDFRENCVQIGARVGRGGEGGLHPNIGLPLENTSLRGELSQDVGITGENGDDNMDDMLQSIAAQSVLQAGCGTEEDVKNAIIDLRRNGKQDFNGRDILKMILGNRSY